MKKIMFNDKYGLTQAVLEGRKTNTRRLIPQKVIDAYYEYEDSYCSINFGGVSAYSMTEFLCGYSRYHVGEIVAIAQCYYDVYGYETCISEIGEKDAGIFNKMFVRAESMPHHIKITNIRVEHLQDITDDDCLKEGIQVLKGGFRNQDAYTFKGDKVWWKTPRAAFAALIDKVSGKGTWDSNPLVWVYEFELVD